MQIVFGVVILFCVGASVVAGTRACTSSWKSFVTQNSVPWPPYELPGTVLSGCSCPSGLLGRRSPRHCLRRLILAACALWQGSFASAQDCKVSRW